MLEDVALYVAEKDPWDIACLLDAVVELTTRSEPASERNSSGSDPSAAATDPANTRPLGLTPSPCPGPRSDCSVVSGDATGCHRQRGRSPSGTSAASGIDDTVASSRDVRAERRDYPRSPPTSHPILVPTRERDCLRRSPVHAHDLLSRRGMALDLTDPPATTTPIRRYQDESGDTATRSRASTRPPVMLHGTVWRTDARSARRITERRRPPSSAAARTGSAPAK